MEIFVASSSFAEAIGGILKTAILCFLEAFWFLGRQRDDDDAPRILDPKLIYYIYLTITNIYIYISHDSQKYGERSLHVWQRILSRERPPTKSQNPAQRGTRVCRQWDFADEAHDVNARKAGDS